jgi:hypothetical protein
VWRRSVTYILSPIQGINEKQRKILPVLSQVKSQNGQWVPELPSHGELIAQIHRQDEKLL